MFCKNCGKEISDNATFCSECGARCQTDNADSSIIVNDNNNKNRYPTKLVIISFVIILIGVVLISILLFGGNNSAKDTDYISAAQTVVSKQLKSPSTAIYTNEKIEAQDKYGRTIVSLNVESQNSFGGYVNNKCYVLIESYDKSNDTFTYNELTGVYISDFGDEYSDSIVEKLKEYTEWDTPIDE